MLIENKKKNCQVTVIFAALNNVSDPSKEHGKALTVSFCHGNVLFMS